MRKLKLLIAAFALLVVGGNTASAQKDVTATYLTNADFSEGTPIDNHVCTYGKDMTTNGTTYYSAQAITGWTNASRGETDNGFENSKLAGALFEYGSTPWLAGAGTPAPATDPEGNAGNAAGLCAVWGGTICYTQDVTLAPGCYTVKFKVYNATTNNGSGKFITTNLFGFVADGGTAYYAPNKTFAIGQWSNIAVTFKLTEETAGKISMGFVGPSGNANMPHLFVDHVKILRNTTYENVTGVVGVEANTNWVDASDGMQGSGVTTDDGRNTKMAARYGTSAVGTVISQTVTGLKKGTYEAVLFAYSQNEWNNNGASLTHDAGDVGYVLADGKYSVHEWINARRGPGYPADGPGIYCLSGIEVDESGNLTLGYAIAKANQTEWHAVQIKSLIYTGNDLEAATALYNEAVEAANAAKDNAIYANVIGQEKTNLISAINQSVDETDAENLSNVALDIKNATEAFIAAKSAYDAYAAMKVKAQGLISQTDSYTDPGTAVSTLNGVISAADEAASTATAATIGTQTENVKKGAFAFLANVTLKTDKLIDVTAFIVNAGFDSNGDGWSITRDGANNWSYSCGEFYEATFDINQTLSDLPAGKSFKLKVQAFQRPGDMASVYAAYAGSTDKTKNVNSEIYVNGKAQKIKNIASEYSATELWNDGTWERDYNPAEGVYVPNSMHGARTYFDTEYADGVNFYENEVAASADEDGNLKFGFRSSVKGNGTWTIFDNFRLYYAGDDLSGFAADLTSAIGSVKTAIDGLAISSYAKTTLKAQADEYEDVYATAAEYSEAIAAVNALETKGGTLVAPYAAWNEAKAAATELFPEEATGPLSVLSAKNDVVEGTIEADDITAATSLVTELCNAYSSFTTQAEAVLAVKDQDVYTDQNSALSTFTDEVSSAIATVNAATIPSAISTQEANLISAVKTFISEVTITQDKCFDITFMIVNQHFTEGLGGTSIPTGWTLESGSIKEHRLATHNFEAYHTQFNLSQTISDLPKGTYKVTLQGFARHDNADILDKTNLYCGPVNQPIKNFTDEYSTTSFYSNEQEAMGDDNRDVQATLNGETIYRPNGMTGAYYWFQETNPITEQPFYTNEVQTMLAKAGDLKIGFKCETNTDWVIWDNFHLYYYGPAIKVEIDEATGKSFSTDIDEANVTLKRTIKANTWNTIMLPFSLTNDELKDAFGDDVEIAEFSEEANGVESTVSFNMMQTPELTANTPVLLKTSTAGTEYIFYSVAIKGIEGEAKVEGTNYDFVGTAGSTTIANGDYFISANQIFRSTGETTILATRAYLKEKTADARIARFDIFSDETTGIAAVNGEKKAETIYNLNGQKVTKAQKGIFIQNGKKVVRK